MDDPAWQDHLVATSDLQLAWYEAGHGPTVVFLNGGPGDDHRYLRPVAAPLTGQFHCVLYDQRGCGRSRLDRLDAATLHVDRFIDDLEALRTELGEDRLRLVGHSWGATLALLYAIAHPERVERLALIAMGPIDDEMSAVAKANQLKPLSPAERAIYTELQARRMAALDAGDDDRVRALHPRLAALSTRAWFASPEAHRRFLAAYLAEQPPNRVVNRLVGDSHKTVRSGLRYEQVTAPILILYGYQDFEPITQAFLLRERMPQACLCFLNECGHVPWLEQPDAFYGALTSFLF